jgi:cellulose synthase (UDP-forming)
MNRNANNNSSYENVAKLDLNEEAKDEFTDSGGSRREILKTNPNANRKSLPKSQSMNSVTFSDIEFGDMELVDSDYTDPTASDSSSEKSIEYGYDFNDQIKQPFWRKFVDRSCVVLAQSLQLLYLLWRWHRFCTTNSTWALSSIFIVMETMIVFFGSLVTYFLVWNQTQRPKLRLENMKMDIETLPTIDVMIPCYNEPVDIVRKTIIAALNLDYPAHLLTVCVCDDGNSPDMRSLITQIRTDLGKSEASLKYVARKKTKGVPHHAKAGNVNNALFNEGLSGDFIVIFDCDMVCKPWMLQAILPHFYLKNPMTESFEVDEKVAMIQTPQSFTNIPLNDLLGQQYRYFYGPVLRGWDSSNSTPCCGTNVLFSRKGKFLYVYLSYILVSLLSILSILSIISSFIYP